MRRRTALAAVVASTATTAGCLGTLSSDEPDDTESTVETTSATTAEPCTPSDSLAVPSVDVPDDPTADAARDLAEFAEETVARERADADGWTVSGVEYVHSETVDGDEDAGIDVYAEVSLDAVESAERADGTGTTLVASLYYEAWYYVSGSRVERAPASDDEKPPADGWVTIACA